MSSSWELLKSGAFNLPVDIDWNNQAFAIACCLFSIAFGFIVLGFDTIQSRRSSGMSVRDSIAGIEHRYFLVLLNGTLIYGILVAGAYFKPSKGVTRL